MPGEGITIAIHKVTGLEFPKAKIRVDTSLVILAVILCFLLLGSWQWQIVGVGTLFAMVYVGVVSNCDKIPVCRVPKSGKHRIFFGETSFYVAYPIFSQLKYPLFMLWTLTSIPYLFRNNCASIGRSRATPIGGIGEIVLVSMNIPFSRRCLLSLHAALPLFFTTILQSAIK